MLSRSLTVVFLALFTLSCKPQRTNSDVAAITGTYGGQEVAAGLLAVNQYLPNVDFNNSSTPSDSVQRLQTMIRIPYFALVMCSKYDSLPADQVLLNAETLSLAGNLVISFQDQSQVGFLDAKSDLSFSKLPCVVMGSRLVSWPVLAAAGLLITGLPSAPPADSAEREHTYNLYRLVQSFYLSLRGSYSKTSTSSYYLSMRPKMMEMAALHEGNNSVSQGQRVQMFEANAKGWDEIFNPCLPASQNWLAKEKRNNNFSCVPVTNSPDLFNYRAGTGGENFENYVNALAQEITNMHQTLFSNDSTSNDPLAPAWDALTTVGASSKLSSNSFVNKLREGSGTQLTNESKPAFAAYGTPRSAAPNRRRQRPFIPMGQLVPQTGNNVSNSQFRTCNGPGCQIPGSQNQPVNPSIFVTQPASQPRGPVSAPGVPPGTATRSPVSGSLPAPNPSNPGTNAGGFMANTTFEPYGSYEGTQIMRAKAAGFPELQSLGFDKGFVEQHVQNGQTSYKYLMNLGDDKTPKYRQIALKQENGRMVFADSNEMLSKMAANSGGAQIQNSGFSGIQSNVGLLDSLQKASESGLDVSAPLESVRKANREIVGGGIKQGNQMVNDYADGWSKWLGSAQRPSKNSSSNKPNQYADNPYANGNYAEVAKQFQPPNPYTTGDYEQVAKQFQPTNPYTTGDYEEIAKQFQPNDQGFPPTVATAPRQVPQLNIPVGPTPGPLQAGVNSMTTTLATPYSHLWAGGLLGAGMASAWGYFTGN